MKREIIFAAVISLLSICPSAFSQGSLTPPGAPAPAMKTLDQIDTHATQIDSHVTLVDAHVIQAGEKRIPIDAAHTPGNDSSVYRITQPGSYYLTGNLTGVSGKYGISVDVGSVTVDLNGFTMTGVSGAFSGVHGGYPNLIVKNGNLIGWPNGGVFAGGGSIVQQLIVNGNGMAAAGASGINATSSTVESCVVSGYTWGIGADPAGFGYGSGATIRNCSGSGNDTGVGCAHSCAVSHSTANGNTANGFNVGSNSAITDSVAEGNGGYGIYAIDACVLSRCLSIANQNQGSAPSGIGIRVGSKSRVTDCTVSDNSGDGIQFINFCLITGNLTANNGTGTAGDGLHSFGSNNRIDSNQVQNNKGSGLHWGGFDIVVRNIAQNNSPGANYNPSSGLTFAPTQTPNSATSPWANF